MADASADRLMEHQRRIIERAVRFAKTYIPEPANIGKAMGLLPRQIEVIDEVFVGRFPHIACLRIPSQAPFDD